MRVKYFDMLKKGCRGEAFEHCLPVVFSHKDALPYVYFIAADGRHSVIDPYGTTWDRWKNLVPDLRHPLARDWAKRVIATRLGLPHGAGVVLVRTPNYPRYWQFEAYDTDEMKVLRFGDGTWGELAKTQAEALAVILVETAGIGDAL